MPGSGGGYCPGRAVAFRAWPVPPGALARTEAGALTVGVEPAVGAELGVGVGPVVGLTDDCTPLVAPVLPGAEPLGAGVGLPDGVAVAGTWLPPSVVPL
ncbi:MAG TPA: hypothetical protein VGD68_09495 [Streptosporangiaceae bacterium]